MTDIDTLKQRVLVLGAVSLLIIIPFYVFIDGLSYAYQLIPFILSVVLLGLPHGAMDHLIPAKLSRTTFVESAMTVGLLYLVVGGLYLAWWFIDAVTALIFFIVLTWLHWGQGDLYALKRLQRGGCAGTPLSNVLYILVRGGIPMLVPLISHPGLYARFISSVLSLFSDGHGTIMFSETTRLVALLAIGGLSIGSSIYHFTIATQHRSLRHWAYTQLETIILWTYFLTLPPVFAVGVYFCVWHSLRHIARMSLVKDGRMRKLLVDQDYGSYLASLTYEATPLTMVSLLGIVGSSLLFLSAFTALESVIAVYLVIVSVLTLPHFIIVSYMDYEENVWAT